MYNRRMWSIARLRQHPHFAPLFAHVHPLCWLILWWELNRLIRWYKTWQPENVLYAVNRWGHVTVHCIVPRPDPHRYQPIPRVFRELSDPSWESSLPNNLASETAEVCLALILPCVSGGGGSLRGRLTEGALTPTPNTS
jgi:hypothetical protein